MSALALVSALVAAGVGAFRPRLRPRLAVPALPAATVSLAVTFVHVIGVAPPAPGADALGMVESVALMVAAGGAGAQLAAVLGHQRGQPGQPEPASPTTAGAGHAVVGQRDLQSAGRRPDAEVDATGSRCVPPCATARPGSS